MLMAGPAPVGGAVVEELESYKEKLGQCHPQDGHWVTPLAVVVTITTL